MDSVSFTKLYAQGEQFPLSVNLSRYTGHLHPSYHTPSSSSVVWMCCIFRAGVGVGGCPGSLGVPATQSSIPRSASRGPKAPLALSTTDAGPKYIIPVVRICFFLFKLPNSRFAVTLGNTETLKTFLFSFFQYLPWVYGTTCHFAKDLYYSFWGRKM